MCFHEPWCDEAQAWLIARDCSWKDLLTVRTHYEGHPPLWWALLAIPAKLGVPYEWGLKSVQLLTAALMIWLLEFKTKLPELLKFIMPFSYFLCYQYGVISRPYALMLASMFLVGINWKNRDSKPWPLVLSMMLLCLASSYGLAIAGMFAVNWIWDFLRKERKLFGNTARSIGLISLLVFAIVVLIDVIPAKNVYHGLLDSGSSPVNPWWLRLLYMWLLVPSETLFTSVVSDSSLSFVSVDMDDLLFTAVWSLLMWAFLVVVSRRRHHAALLISTYLAFSIVAASHFYVHHEGIVLGFFLTILIIDCADERLSARNCPPQITSLLGKLARQMSERGWIMLKKCGAIIGVLAMMISVYWTASSCIRDIRYNYDTSRAMANLIRKYDLDDYRWVSGWSRICKTQDSNSAVSQYIDAHKDAQTAKGCVDFTKWPGTVLLTANPYFDHNLIDNSQASYLSWNWLNEVSDAKKDKAEWRAKGEPEFFATIYQPFYFSDLGYDRNDYVKFKIADTVTPWKDRYGTDNDSIYIRKDIYHNVMHSPDTGFTWADGKER
ncbi:hypothetical protein KIH75_09475 [Bifidobacterium sp. 64T4]|nr:hypothetical protein [Bifidobacterium pongonis]